MQWLATPQPGLNAEKPLEFARSEIGAREVEDLIGRLEHGVFIVSLTAWRIYKPKHAATAFTGEEASLFGGRWNNKGVAVVYTASSISVAALEMLVHLQAAEILKKYVVRSVVFQ